MVSIENASLAELRQALDCGAVTAVGLARAYLARIAAYDTNGPKLNSVREINPDALDIAAKSDARLPGARRKLEGLPILLKDNIATGDRQHTTAGSVALEHARAARDATVVTPDTALAMSICFRDAPRDPVMAQVTIRPDSAATASPAALVFTPENHNSPQTITLRAKSGALGAEPFKVAVGSSSRDFVFHGLSDEWDYVASRHPTR